MIAGTGTPCFEIRVPKAGRYKTISGMFDNIDAAIKNVEKWASVPEVHNIYVTLNPVNDSLLARSYNSMKQYSEQTTADADIIRRNLLLVDCDPMRPAGISSSDEEKQKAFERCNEVNQYLCDGMKWPKPVIADSGNGYHLLFKIDLPNDADSNELVSNCLKELDNQFSDDMVSIDTTVSNAGRITKLYGTTAKKGDNIPKRPHRVSRIIEMPDTFEAVPTDKISQFATLGMMDATPTPANATPTKKLNKFILPEWLEKQNVEIIRKIDGKETYIVECPWNPDHRDATVQQFDGGSLGFHCHHDTCSDKHWHQFREYHEPDAYTNAGIYDISDFDLSAFGKYRPTDGGNAKRLTALHGSDIRYCYPFESWFIWTGDRWELDCTGEIVRRAKDTVERIFAHAMTIDDADKRNAMLKHGMQSDSKHRLFASFDLAQSEPGIAIKPEQLDANNWIFNVRNGTLDLRSGQLRAHQKADLCTKIANVDFDTKAKCPTWISFLTRILNGDPELIAYVQRLAGSCLSGEVLENAFYVLYGTGSNGKSTFIEVLAGIFGDYATTVPASALMEQKNQSIPNDVAKLKGARMANAAESKATEHLDEAKIKNMTGREAITARFLHKEFFDFTPQYTLTLSTNHKPIITGTDNGVWRRVNMVPFTVTIPDEEINPNLYAELMSEAAGILNWVIEGCMVWQKSGVGECEAVNEATQEYRDDMDALKEFIDERCIAYKTAEVGLHVIFGEYLEWCDTANVKHTFGKQKFTAKLIERGFNKKRKNDGTYIKGIKMNDGSEHEEHRNVNQNFTKVTNVNQNFTASTTRKHPKNEKVTQNLRFHPVELPTRENLEQTSLLHSAPPTMPPRIEKKSEVLKNGGVKSDFSSNKNNPHDIKQKVTFSELKRKIIEPCVNGGCHRLVQLGDEIQAKYGDISDTPLNTNTAEKIESELDALIVKCKYHGSPCYHGYHNASANTTQVIA